MASPPRWRRRLRAVHCRRPGDPPPVLRGREEAAGESGPAARGVGEQERTGLAVQFEDVAAASFRLRNGIQVTDCARSSRCSQLTGVEVFFKEDLKQLTGSFKERGARNALLLLDEGQRGTGVIAASAGNHALALAYHASQLGVPVTCVMPNVAPLTKVSRCREYGAEVVMHGAHIGEARERALEIGAEQQLQYINGYDDPAIIAGAGTMGIEILDQMSALGEELDAVVVPVGGGGLIAGVATVIKELRPSVEVIGVEPEECPSLTAALAAGKPVQVPFTGTLADGLAVPTLGQNAFEICREKVDRVVTVSEASVALAVLRLLEQHNTLVEGGGAAGFAALIQDGVLPDLAGKTVCVPLCGGNIDITTVARVIDRGLAADGRLVRFVATISDRAGGIADLAKVVSSVGASFKEVHHERAFVQKDLFAVQVHCLVELAGREHGEELQAALREAGYPVAWNDDRGLEAVETAQPRA